MAVVTQAEWRPQGGQRQLSGRVCWLQPRCCGGAGPDSREHSSPELGRLDAELLGSGSRMPAPGGHEVKPLGCGEDAWSLGTPSFGPGSLYL